MTPIKIIPEPRPAPPARLGALVITAWRRLRVARLIIRRSRDRYRAVLETLRAALALLAEQNAQIDRLRSENCALRGELRRYTAWQLAEERST